jgi:hypothetical protein
MIFSCAIIPTGRYFIAVGSMDMLIFAYWFIILYLLVGSRIGFYLNRVG